MRTIDPALSAALASGNITPYIHVIATGVDVQPIAYKLTGLTLQVEFNTPALAGKSSFKLRRGVVIDGVPCTLDTSSFASQQVQQKPGRYVYTGHLIPPHYVNFLADGTYQGVIETFCALFGKTAVFKDASSDWLDYQFYPTGGYLTLNNAQSFFTLLRQKWLICATDNGDDEILFFSADEGNSDDYNPVTNIVSNDYDVQASYAGEVRQFVWKDELGVVHTSGSPTLPRHNLGYLPSTANPPETDYINHENAGIVPINLELQDGDWIQLYDPAGNLITYPHCIQVIESLDSSRKSLPWHLDLGVLPYLGNTEGGDLPGNVVEAGQYIPVNVSSFTNILFAHDTNVQRALETLDEHAHISYGTTDPLAEIPGVVLYVNTAMDTVFVWADGKWYAISAMPTTEWMYTENFDHLLDESESILLME